MPNAITFINLALGVNFPLAPKGGFMSQVTTSDIQTLADSIAFHILTAAAVPGSVATLQGAQATTLAHIVGLNDAQKVYALLDGVETAQAAENAWITKIQNYNDILDIWLPALASIDLATGGLSTFMGSTIQVDPHFLDAWTRAVSRNGGNPAKVIGNWQAFGQAIANMAAITLTGAGAGTFAAGTSQSANYGNAPLSIKNIGGTTGGANGIYTVTYNAYNGSGVLQTGLTAQATMPSGSVVNTTVTLAVSGVAVTNITVSGGTTSDHVAVIASLLRVVTA